MGERQRGRLTSISKRTELVKLIRDAKQAGARLRLACEEVEISLRTYKRWFKRGIIQADKRPEAVRPTPSNKLSEAEQQMILAVSNETRFASLPLLCVGVEFLSGVKSA